MYNPFSLDNKTLLVTGASSGIGRATAIECSKMGAHVILTGRNEQRLIETYELLESTGHEMYIADFNNENDLSKLINRIKNLDGIVNAAGIIKTLPFQFVNEAELLNIFHINFFMPVLLTEKMIKEKKLNRGGSIVFISSIEGILTVHIGNSMYAASKGALSAMAKNMALELAYKKIRVNCILPGMTETPLIKLDNITEEQLNIDRSHYPLKRFGKPEEVAYAAIYLLSDASSWVTGTSLVIDGGFTLL